MQNMIYADETFYISVMTKTTCEAFCDLLFWSFTEKSENFAERSIKTVELAVSYH